MPIPAATVIEIAIELLRLAQRARKAGKNVTWQQIAEGFAKADEAEGKWNDAGTTESTEEP